jgi:prepilin-type N-terminal cleavage/methylation domain-containing protein
MRKKYLKTKNGRQILRASKGYTIIETMIAISIFLILIMTGMTTLMNAFSLHKKSQNMRSEIDNLSFIMEDISRNLRTGTKFYCLNDYDSDSFATSDINQRKSSPVDGSNVRQLCWGIAFEAAGGGLGGEDQWVYYIDGNGAIQKATMGPYTDPFNFTQLTPNDVKLNPVSGFYIFGAESTGSGDSQQPFIKIILAGKVTERGIESPFSLETVVSSRIIDTF